MSEQLVLFWMSFKVRPIYSQDLLIHQYQGMPDKFIGKAKKNAKKKTPNEITALLENILEQSKTVENCRSAMDDAQPFVREFSMFVLSQDQKLNNISCFCTDRSHVSASPRAFDTTFNTGEYKFSQSI